MTSAVARSAWAETSLAPLGLPEPPGDLARRVVDLADLRAGTRPMAPPLRRLAVYATEAEDPATEEYVLAGIEEVSGGLIAVHYLVLFGHLFLGLQMLVDADDDGIVVTEDLRSGFTGAAEFQLATIEAASRGALGRSGRLIVIEGAFGRRTWWWTGPSPDEGGRGITGATEFLESLLRR
jgi:hypothetical protein